MKPLETRILSEGLKSVRITANIDSSDESNCKIQLLDDDYNGDVKVLYGRKHCSTVQEVMDDVILLLSDRKARANRIERSMSRYKKWKYTFVNGKLAPVLV